VFWYVCAVTLAVLGVAVLIEVQRGRRLAAFLVLLAACCFGIATLLRRAA